MHRKDWCWSWNSNTLATWCRELTHLKRPWCWERLRAGGEGDNRGWDGWMASLTQWTWVWVNSWSWWWTGRPGMLQSMGSQRVRHGWATELNYTTSFIWGPKSSQIHWDRDRMVGARGWVEGTRTSYCLMEQSFSFARWKESQRLAAQPCECT